MPTWSLVARLKVWPVLAGKVALSFRASTRGMGLAPELAVLLAALLSLSALAVTVKTTPGWEVLPPPGLPGAAKV